MQRERATRAEDLPHRYQPASRLGATGEQGQQQDWPCEVCEQDLGAAVHRPPTQLNERAAHQLLRTEKGS